MKFKKFFKIADKQYIDAIYGVGTIGLHMVSCTVVGLAAGFFLDKWLDTRPVLTILFLLIGIAAGYKNIYLEAKRLQRQQDGDGGDESVEKKHGEDRSGDAP